MSTIPSTMSAAGQCGLDYNIAITANNEKVIAQIELNQESSQAANKMNLAGSKAQEASGLSQASQMRSQAIGEITAAVGGCVSGFGLIGLENNFANKAQLASRSNDMEVEMKEISPAARPVSAGTGSGVPAATVEGNIPTGYEAPATAAKPTTEPVKSPLEQHYENKARQVQLINRFLPDSIQGAAKSAGTLAAANEKQNQAADDAMSTVTGGLRELLSKNADAATAAQSSAENNKEALIKALEAMILANRVA